VKSWTDWAGGKLATDTHRWYFNLFFSPANGPFMRTFILQILLMALLPNCMFMDTDMLDMGSNSEPSSKPQAAKESSEWAGTLNCRDCVDSRTDGTDQIDLTIKDDKVSGHLGLFGWMNGVVTMGVEGHIVELNNHEVIIGSLIDGDVQGIGDFMAFFVDTTCGKKSTLALMKLSGSQFLRLKNLQPEDAVVGDVLSRFDTAYDSGRILNFTSHDSKANCTPTATPAAVAQRWNDSITGHDMTGFSSTLASTLRYYKKNQFSARDATARKTRSLSRSPDFRQEIIGDIQTEKTVDGLRLSFSKRYFTGGTATMGDTVLELQQIGGDWKVTLESDSATERAR
jgi:hypothetical protein